MRDESIISAESDGPAFAHVLAQRSCRAMCQTSFHGSVAADAQTLIRTSPFAAETVLSRGHSDSNSLCWRRIVVDFAASQNVHHADKYNADGKYDRRADACRLVMSSSGRPITQVPPVTDTGEVHSRDQRSVSPTLRPPSW